MGRLGKVRGLYGHPRASFFKNSPQNRENSGLPVLLVTFSFAFPVRFLLTGIGVVFRVAPSAIREREKGRAALLAAEFCRPGDLHYYPSFSLAVVDSIHILTCHVHSFSFLGSEVSSICIITLRHRFVTNQPIS
jgi:hypothetical protein